MEEVSVEGVFYLRAIISCYLRSPNSDLSLVTSEKAIKMVLWRLDCLLFIVTQYIMINNKVSTITTSISYIHE